MKIVKVKTMPADRPVPERILATIVASAVNAVMWDEFTGDPKDTPDMVWKRVLDRLHTNEKELELYAGIRYEERQLSF